MGAWDAYGVSDPDDMVTAQDVAVLNRAMVERAAAFARIGGTALIVVGALGLLAALWILVRGQQTVDAGGSIFGSGGTDVELVDRIDLMSAQFSVVVAPGIALAAGLAVRLMADYTVGRSGGTLTGFEVGDHFPPGDPGDADDLPLPPPPMSP